MARSRRATPDPAPVQPAGREVPHPTRTSRLLVREVPVNRLVTRTASPATATTTEPASEPGQES